MAEFSDVEKMKVTEGGEVVRLMASPETRAGLEAARAKVEDYWSELEEAGHKIAKRFEGVAPDGTCIEVARYLDASNQREGIGFAVFAYDLRRVTSPEFAEELAPAHIGRFVEYSGGGIDIAVERPDDPMPERGCGI